MDPRACLLIGFMPVSQRFDEIHVVLHVDRSGGLPNSLHITRCRMHLYCFLINSKGLRIRVIK
jgi:hypothetical protein